MIFAIHIQLVGLHAGTSQLHNQRGFRRLGNVGLRHHIYTVLLQHQAIGFAHAGGKDQFIGHCDFHIRSGCRCSGSRVRSCGCSGFLGALGIFQGDLSGYFDHKALGHRLLHNRILRLIAFHCFIFNIGKTVSLQNANGGRQILSQYLGHCHRGYLLAGAIL